MSGSGVLPHGVKWTCTVACQNLSILLYVLLSLLLNMLFCIF